jgi:hypothetical protein
MVSLAATLNKTYDRVLCAIGKEDFEYAVRILQWWRSLRGHFGLRKLLRQFAIDPSRLLHLKEEVLEEPLDVQSICSGLVAV